MKTNNLTPDENLKNPPNYNPDEEPIKFYDRVEAPGIIFGYATSDEELSESGAIIVYLFTTIFILVIGFLLFYLL